MSQDFIVIGGGPAGLASAIFLSKKGYKVSIFEKNSNLEQKIEESYPIGINPRGMRVLEKLEGLVERDLNNNDNNNNVEGEKKEENVLSTLIRDMKRDVIEGWNIYVYGWKVASVKSGTTCGATRGGVVQSLYHVAQKEENITFHFEHKLNKVNFDTKELTFEKEGEEKEEVVVGGEGSRVIAGDGVWSKVRRELERHSDEKQENLQKATLHPWGSHFRLLFTSPDADEKIPLSGAYHHILTGTYLARVDDKRWVICMQLKETDKGWKELTSYEASEGNIKKLKKTVLDKIPFANDVVPEEEYTNFFSRRMFTGAVVHSSFLQYKDWVAFLGDSAHSVLPATGEGVNSALEDASVLNSCFPPKNDSVDNNNPFPLYEERRLPDTQGLTNYAKFLVGGWAQGQPPAPIVGGSIQSDEEDKKHRLERKTSFYLSTLLMRLGTGLGVNKEKWAEKSFGVEAREVVEYREMYGQWERETGWARRAGGAVGGAVGWVCSWFV